MSTNNSSGKNISIAVGVWLFIKVILNMLIDGINLSQLGGDLGNIILAAAEFVLLYLGIKYTNYVVAALLALMAIIYLPGNIKGIFSFDTILTSLIYIVEAVVDVVCAITICMSANVKEHFTKSLSDLSGGK